jgi:GNAT superfamily N-acetyltransferase
LSLEFGVFDDRELAQQRALFENAFPEHRDSVTSSVEHYQWKFHGFPAVPPSFEYVARDAGKLLGYYAAIPYLYRIDNRPMRVGMVCDVMTHSDARGRGVFTDLGRYALDQMHASELAFVTGYPIRPEVMGGHLRVGWTVAFELPMYLRPLRADAIMRSKGIAWLAPLVNAGLSAYGVVVAPRARAGGYTSVIGSPGELLDSAEFERFREAWSASVRHHLIKSAEFYGWRLGAPGTSYRVFVVRQGAEVVAVAVGREAPLQGIPSFALLDAMVLPGHERALSLLYRDIEREARRRGVEAIVTMMSRHSARRYRLKRFGFLRSPFTFKLIVRSVSDSLAAASISTEADWHLMWIDSDDL